MHGIPNVWDPKALVPVNDAKYKKSKSQLAATDITMVCVSVFSK